jgi:hypothetical protein
LAFAGVLARPFLLRAAADFFLGDGFAPFVERTAAGGFATRFAPFDFEAARAASMRDFGRTRRR